MDDRRPILTLRRLWLSVPFIVLAWSATRTFTDNSFLWHVRSGTIQLGTGEIIRKDPFSFSHGGEPWRTQSWLAELGYGRLERLTGGIGWAPLLVFVAMAAMVLLVGVLIRRSPTGMAGSLVTLLLVAWMTVPFSFPRPAVLAFPLLALLTMALSKDDADWWAAPPLIWLWACVHGSFVLGLGYTALVAVSRRSRRGTIALGLAAIAASLTAHGLALWGIVADFAMNREALGLIEEWRPPSLLDDRTWPYFLMAGLVALAFVTRKVPRRELLIVVPFALFGVMAVRNLLPAVIVLAPYAARALPMAPSGAETVPDRAQFRLNAVIAAALATITVIGLARPVPLSETVFPSAATLDALGTEPAFHGIGEAGMIVYSRWPQVNVLIDDRAELYGADELAGVLDAEIGSGWEQLFAEWRLTNALVVTGSGLSSALRQAGWVKAHGDDHFEVYRASP